MILFMILLLFALNCFAYDFELDYEPTEEDQVIHIDNLYLCHLCGYEVVILGLPEEKQENNSDQVDFEE
jgi:hypothetical protein